MEQFKLFYNRSLVKGVGLPADYVGPSEDSKIRLIKKESDLNIACKVSHAAEDSYAVREGMGAAKDPTSGNIMLVNWAKVSVGGAPEVNKPVLQIAEIDGTDVNQLYDHDFSAAFAINSDTWISEPVWVPSISKFAVVVDNLAGTWNHTLMYIHPTTFAVDSYELTIPAAQLAIAGFANLKYLNMNSKDALMGAHPGTGFVCAIDITTPATPTVTSAQAQANYAGFVDIAGQGCLYIVPDYQWGAPRMHASAYGVDSSGDLENIWLSENPTQGFHLDPLKGAAGVTGYEPWRNWSFVIMADGLMACQGSYTTTGLSYTFAAVMDFSDFGTITADYGSEAYTGAGMNGGAQALYIDGNDLYLCQGKSWGGIWHNNKYTWDAQAKTLTLAATFNEGAWAFHPWRLIDFANSTDFFVNNSSLEVDFGIFKKSTLARVYDGAGVTIDPDLKVAQQAVDYNMSAIYPAQFIPPEESEKEAVFISVLVSDFEGGKYDGRTPTKNFMINIKDKTDIGGKGKKNFFTICQVIEITSADSSCVMEAPGKLLNLRSQG